MSTEPSTQKVFAGCRRHGAKRCCLLGDLNHYIFGRSEGGFVTAVCCPMCSFRRPLPQYNKRNDLRVSFGILCDLHDVKPVIKNESARVPVVSIHYVRNGPAIFGPLTQQHRPSRFQFLKGVFEYPDEILMSENDSVFLAGRGSHPVPGQSIECLSRNSPTRQTRQVVCIHPRLEA